MKAFLLSAHVVAAVVLVGPVTMAVSVFPRHARAALAPDGERAAALAALLHRVSRGYAVLSLSVPVLGVALAGRMGVLGDAWVVASIVLTVAAAALLAAVVLPDQQRLMAALDRPGAAAAPPTGLRSAAPHVFALTWVAVVVLMVVRPGSTTGV